ncbi:Na(+)/H(+) antiporter NhaA [Sphaerisporangium siamense]|uniref:Na(+)/H(+) antiporter NhaA n=1 Tax=Sphaerisporangium siamense TaxID=795645 RepID=A0A7W7G6L8_9ACTN|nr:Na+/H+ antiporter NhaA [Sphaerisporangium siamense]MBB4699683.1 NhaA family Na+:H+ antiporter [Sphaerisporangium siamense]GII87862.1 Na(+)/H(+) antiporter NhaA [Sphaerisporangium siamense]
MGTSQTKAFRLLGRGSKGEAGRIAAVLREETVGGALLLFAAVAGLVWANSPWSGAYHAVRAFEFGPAALHLRLNTAAWAADGLLAIFFFVAGLELKREFIAGDLRRPRQAAVPVAAALGGVIVPAAIYLCLTMGTATAKGWAIPTATDIAFALAVLAVAGRHLPSALRAFLLALAVVDDLVAIVIIAVFYTTHLSVPPLLAALLPLAAFAVLVRRGVRAWWLLIPLAVVTWALVHASGVHATVAGVLLAFAVPVRRADAPGSPAGSVPGSVPDLAGHFEHRFRPISASLAVPVFAFLSAGVTLGGLDGVATALGDPVAVGVATGLVIGKPAGVMAATWLVARFTRAELDSGLAWIDVLGLSVLAGMGFTVSLLIGELAFGADTTAGRHVTIAVLAGSLTAAVLASVILRLRGRVYLRIRQAEENG